MKKFLLPLMCSLLMLAACVPVHSQNINSAKFKAFKAAHEPVKTGMVKAPAVGNTGTIVLLTPDINLSFSRVQKIDGNWGFGGSLVPSVSYNLVIGDGKQNADGSVDVQPYISFGAFAGYGVASNGTGQLVSAADVGGTLGIYKFISVAGGYDCINNHPFFAIGAKISLFTFRGGSGATILSYK